MKKKLAPLLLSGAILTGALAPVSFAEEGTTTPPVVEPTEDQQLENTTYVEEASEPSELDLLLNPKGETTEPQYAVMPGDPYVSGYTLIDTFTGTSSVIDTASEWFGQFAAAAIPIMLSKNPWAGAAGTATHETFWDPPSTRYYKTWVYQAKGTNYYYGKAVTKQYSDSARTNLVKTVTHISRVAR